MSSKAALVSVAGIAAVSALAFGAVSKSPGATAVNALADVSAPSSSSAIDDSATRIRERNVRVSADVSLHVVERGDPNGTPVVLLHGLSDSWSSFSRVSAHFPTDLRLIAFDLRGHGESSKPVGDYRMRTLATDVAAVFDSLDLTGVHVIGHSMGSLIAQHLAAQRANRVESLVLIGSTRGGAYIPGMDGFLNAFAEYTNEDEPVPDEFARSFQVSTLHAPVPPAFLDSVTNASLKLPVRVWKSLLNGLITDSGPPVRSAVRTLIVWGEKDTYMPRAEQTELVNLYNATFVQFDSAGHAPHWERPEQAARMLVQFIKDEPGQPVK